VAVRILVTTYFYERFNMSLTRAGFILALVTISRRSLGAFLERLWSEPFRKDRANGRISAADRGADPHGSSTMIAVDSVFGGRSFKCKPLCTARPRVHSKSINADLQQQRPSDKVGHRLRPYIFPAQRNGSIGILLVGTLRSPGELGISLSMMSLPCLQPYGS